MKKILLFLITLIAVWAFIPIYANAANITVCASGGGCTVTNYNAADALANCGDTITLKAGGGNGTGIAVNGTPVGWFGGGGGSPNTNNPAVFTKNCPANNPILITTDQVSKLPPANTRIIPSYLNGASPVIPVIYNPGTGMVAYAQPGNGGLPGAGYKIVGVGFCCSSGPTGGFFSDFLPIGSRGQGTADTALIVQSDVPNNFILDRILLMMDPTKNTRRCITFDALALSVINSYIPCGYDNVTSDSQGVASFQGGGKFNNNYLAGATESISAGGALGPILTPVVGTTKATDSTILSSLQPANIEMAWNDITKDVNWVYVITWNSSMGLVAKGKVIRATSPTSTILQATNVGTACATQPTWPASVGGTVTDCGGVVWVRLADNTIPQAKNLFECKTCVNLNIHHNFFHYAWPQGQQGYAFTLTSSPSGGAVQQVTNVAFDSNYTRDVGAAVNNSGQDVANDINAIPSIMTNAGPWTIVGGTNDNVIVTINGTVVNATLTAGVGRTSTQVIADLTAAFNGAGVGIACSDNLGAVILRGRVIGDGSTCGGLASNYPVGRSSISVGAGNANTTLGLTGKSSPGCTNPRSGVWYGCGVYNGFFFNNNLLVGINSATYYSGVPYLYALFQHEANTQYRHTTIQMQSGQSNPNGAAVFTGLDPLLQTFPPYNVLYRDSILSYTNSAPGSNYCNNGTTTDFTCINYYFCQPNLVDSAVATPTDSVCAAGVFSHNVIPGATLAATPTLSTTITNNSGPGFNRYPSDNYTTSLAGLNFAANSFKVQAPPGPGTDGLVPGVDPTTLPRIYNPKIVVSDKAAIISYQVTEPMANSGLDCVVYGTTKPSEYYTAPVGYDTADSAPVIADLDPSNFNQPGWDGADNVPRDGLNRYILLGLNASLGVSSTNYYRLMCAGATYPEDGSSFQFVTRPAQSGNNTILIKGTPTAAIGAVASMKVTYGTAYSKMSGAITGGGNSTVACTAGNVCSVSAVGAKGTILYTQVQYLDAGAAVLKSNPVIPYLP